MAYIEKIITANNIVNGSAVTHKTRKGDIQSVNPEITRNSLNFNTDVDSRFDNPRMFTGDSNGLQTTVTYNIVQNEGDVNVSTNEGYWSTSKTSSHNPASVGYTSGPTSVSNSWKAGFDRTSTRYKYKKGFVRFLDVQVPQGATILASTLKLNFKDGEDVNYTLSGFDADNPDPSTMSASDGDHSTHTTANVTFNVPSNGSQDGANDNLTTSPDIKDIVQELVDRGGWAAGNAMMFVFPIISVYSSDEYRMYWTWFDDRTPKTELSITYS